MSPHLALLILSTSAAVLAIFVLIGEPAAAGKSEGAISNKAPTSPDVGVAVRLAVSLTAALVIISISGWLIPAVVVSVGTWYSIQTFQRRDRKHDDVARTDALASWIENLRDVLIAGDQPIGAISTTVATCPPAIRPAVRRLSAGLGRQDPDVVFRRFADDLDDPLGDLVAAGLLIAVQRGARTVAVLTSLAAQAREQADRRRLVEAERAPIQREVSMLTLIMGSLIVGLLVFGRAEYLRPYDSPGGQVFIGIVIAIYAALLLRVQRLARYPRPRRFLSSSPQRHEMMTDRLAQVTR